MKNFSDKLVLITGAGSGIGRLLSLELANLGAKLILLDVNFDSIKKVASEIKSIKSRVWIYKCDLSVKSEISMVVKEIKKIGKVDILINNVGVVSGKSFLEISDKQIETSFNVNLLSFFWLTRSFLPDMIKENSGHIVNIASAAGLIGVAGLSDYSATKFGVFGFNESLRMELRKKKINGVKTTIVCPYYINTGMFKGVKSRFNFLLPILEEKYVCKKVIRSIQKNKEVLIMPQFVKFIPLVRLLPTFLMDSITELIGISSSMDHFVGRSK